ncbi:hypothetical protein DFH08DRAFT_125779 [Mycena albidolilacea]|uniref:Uncharacterized protein n=1 Tax=Mycena albidolilacea TaxID=1033008 RepID=A0AAD7A6B2_9AGAR|nr:hypothetical protein DFH08DRAFT_125779 [Mycena albidolilacea]
MLLVLILTGSLALRRNTTPLRLRVCPRAVLVPCAGSGCARGCLARHPCVCRKRVARLVIPLVITSARENAVYKRRVAEDCQWFRRVCVSWVRCRAAWGHGVLGTVCVVRRRVPAISLAWWRMMRRATYCGLLTVPPCLRQLGTLSSGAGYAGPSAVSNYGGSSASQLNYCASSTNYPSAPPAHPCTSSSSPSNA